jgi:hypothetical protein
MKQRARIIGVGLLAAGLLLGTFALVLADDGRSNVVVSRTAKGVRFQHDSPVSGSSR